MWESKADWENRDTDATFMKRILIVDPDSSARASMRQALLDSIGYGVGEASDGATALEALTQGPYDLVITELLLPMMTGIEMLTLLRRQPRFRSLPVIVATNERDDALVRRVVSLGIGDYMIKPLNLERLCTRATALLGARKPAAPEGDAAPAPPPPRGGRIVLPPLR